MNSISKKLVVLLGLSGLFVGNSFAMMYTVDQLRGLYATLCTLQKDKIPAGKDARDESAAIKGKISCKGVLTSITYQELIYQAQKTTGLNAMYNYIVLEGERLAEAELQLFIQPGNLQWTAYLQNKHGKGGIFTYNSSGAGQYDYDNPVMGSYISSEDNWRTITRYGFLEGLFEALDRASKEGVSSPRLASSLRALGKNLMNAIVAAKAQAANNQ